MKTELTIEESAKLIELGVDAKLASKCESAMKVCASGRGIIRLPESRPIFTLSDLLSILPKRIDTDEDVHTIVMSMDEEADVWYAAYMGFSKTQFASELIDALNQLLIWCLEQGHCKCGKGGGR